LALITIATVRVALTYGVFSHTIDEPSHIASGMEWLDKKTYTLEHLHPPLARVMAALGPYFAGYRSSGHREMYWEGIAILHERDNYDGVLMLARMGILPFLWGGSLVVYAWSRRYFGAAVAVMAVFLFTQLPGILAHSGLATTDMAATAFVGAAVYAVLVWLEQPTARHTLVAGGCLGLAVLSKFSSLVLVPGALIAMFGWYVITERPSVRQLLDLARPRLVLLPLGLGIASLVVWAGYQFSYGKVHFSDIRLPAPELYSGVAAVLEHNREGHPGYLLGERSRSGWWYFFPVALSMKTPLPFMLMALAGAVVAARSNTPARWPLTYSIGLLLCVMPSRINIGIRHILAIYVGLAILAAVFAVDCLRQRRKNPWRAWVITVLLVWLTASVGFSQPDYLSYFNALAGPQPERFLVDSDLDWGQDLKRLAKRLQELGAREVAAIPPGLSKSELMLTHLRKLGFPRVTDLDLVTPSPGWNAVSLTVLKLWMPDGPPPRVPWPEVIKPKERVGAAILLYYFGRPETSPDPR
jgi:4-amino-4-deoxy-L-arabinose transferase-like glycosyltransferase